MKTALVIGASRGIGRQIAKTFAENGYKVCVAAKTVESSKKTPGTIYDVAKEIHKCGGEALPVKCDARSEADIENAISSCIKHFGCLDVAIYNAGAIAWTPVIDTPVKKWDLMNDINARGPFTMVTKVLPHMTHRKSGRIIIVAPPIYSRFFKGKTPYSMTKIASTVLVHGLANELAGTGVSISALWTATPIESQVTVVKKVPPAFYRKADIFSDACLRIAEENSDKLNGKALIDEDYLRSEGVTDFTKYRADPDKEPPRMMPSQFPSLLVPEEDESFPTQSKL